jgi:hypothetical protein
MFGIFRDTGLMGKHSSRRSQSGYMVAAALASVALIAGATAMVMTSVTTASKTANKVSARAKLSSDLDSAFAFLANSGMLGVDSNGGITNMFYAPPAINAREIQPDLPDIYGAVPQLNTVDPNGKLVGYVAFYNGPRQNSDNIYQAFQQGQRTVQPIYLNESLTTAINANNVPAMAFVAPGANGRLDLKEEPDLLRAITREENGMTVLKSSSEINQYLSDNGIDDRIIARNGFDARNTQGQTTTSLVQNTTDCPEETHKLVYRPRDGGGTEFVCVRERDPNILYSGETPGPMVVNNITRRTLDGAEERTLNFVSLASQLGGMITGGSGITVNSSTTGVQISINRSDSGLFPTGACAADQRVTWNGNNFSCAVTATGGGNPTGITSVAFRYLANPSPAGSGDVVANVENSNTLLLRRIRSADTNLQVQTTANEVIIRNTAPATNIQGRNIGGQPCGNRAAGNIDPALLNLLEEAGLTEMYMAGSPSEQRQLASRLGYTGGGRNNPASMQNAMNAQVNAAAATRGNADPCDFQEVYAGKADAMTLMFRRLEGGPGVVLSDGKVDANGYPSIKITSDPAAAGALVDVRNVGNGVPLARKNGGLIEVKTLRGTGGTLIRTVGDVVEIEAPGGITAGDVNTQIANYLSANVFPAASCPAGQVLTYSASATPRLLCVSTGGFWAVDSTNPAGIVPTTTAVRIPNNADFFLGDLTRSGTSINGNGVAISGDAGSQIAGTTLISEAGLTNLANNSGVNTTATLSGGSLGLVINGVGTPGNGNSIFTASRQSMVMERRAGSNDNITYTVFNRGISMGGSGGADFFRLDIPETGNVATMRLNGQQILGMPNTECTATQVLTFRGNQLTCVDGGSGGPVFLNAAIDVFAAAQPTGWNCYDSASQLQRLCRTATGTNWVTFNARTLSSQAIPAGTSSIIVEAYVAQGWAGSANAKMLARKDATGAVLKLATISRSTFSEGSMQDRPTDSSQAIVPIASDGSFQIQTPAGTTGQDSSFDAGYGLKIIGYLSGGGTGSGSPVASLPTCTAGQTLIANASGTLECANMPAQSGSGARLAAAPIAGTALSAVSTNGTNQSRNGAINSQAAVIKADLLCTGSDNGSGARSAGVTRLVFKNASNATISDVNLCAMVSNSHGGGAYVAGVPATWGNTPYGTSTNRSLFTEYVPIPDGAVNVEITAYNDATIEISQFAYASSGTGGSTQVFYTCQPTFALAGGATGAENQPGNPCFEARKGIQVQTRYLPIACHNNADNRIAGGTMKWGTGFGASGNPSGATSFWTSDNAGGTDASACIGNVIVADTQATGGGGGTGGGATGFTLAHLGSGITLASQTAGNTNALSLKTLRQGAGISITESNGEITIANTGSGGSFNGTLLGTGTTSLTVGNTTVLRSNFPTGASKILVEGTCSITQWGTSQVSVDFMNGSNVLYSITICQAVTPTGSGERAMMRESQILDLPSGADRVRINNQTSWENYGGMQTGANYRFLQ